MYDAEDDPDRLYYSRGLGRLDSDEDSEDEGSDGLGEGDLGFDDGDVRPLLPFIHFLRLANPYYAV
jgi:mitogen-activated protein kinase kinase kinase